MPWRGIRHSIWSLAAWLLAFGIFSGASAQTVPAAFRDQFTDSQWRALQSIRYTPLILPAHVPTGYRVIRVDVVPPRSQSCGFDCGDESYTVAYSNGKHIIKWGGSNWTAGGDAATASFRAWYNSSLFGKGVVFMISNCWRAYSLDDRGQTSFFSFYSPRGGRGGAFHLDACDPGLSPREVALMMQTTVLLKHNFVPNLQINLVSITVPIKPFGGVATIVIRTEPGAYCMGDVDFGRSVRGAPLNPQFNPIVTLRPGGQVADGNGVITWKFEPPIYGVREVEGTAGFDCALKARRGGAKLPFRVVAY